MTLFDRIKKLRKEKNITQEELAKKVGYKSRSTINKIESGLRDISQSQIILFANALSVTPAYLMGWEDEPEATYEFSKRIKQLRNELGLSQIELAEKVGYKDRTSIAKVESGKIDLPQSKIIDFAKALNVTPAYLMGWEDEPNDDIQTIAAHHNDEDWTEEELEEIEAFKQFVKSKRKK
ncbi:helix-turn-helix transcriptional regulator [Vallitaleaceae bacterium 9-2]